MDQPKGIDRDAMRFQVLGTILDWLSGTNSLDLVCKCFLGRPELKTTIFFPHNQYNKKKLLLEIERTLLIFDYY